jgi:hypothetical protein
MAYTWFIGTNQASQIVTTYPVVSIAQNGSGAAATSTQVFDQYGNLLWTLDPRGFINQQIFDATIAAVTESVQDFNTTTHPGIAPAGWTTPAGGGLHLITDTSYDAQGRPIQVLGPSHPVDGNTVRTASWTVYRDDLDQVWNAQGYASGTGPSYTYTLVNPVSITQLDDDGRSIGQISATRGTTVESAGALSASDSYPQSSWVRWSTTTYDDEGDVASTQVYFNIPTSGAGAAGINFNQTVLGYDSMDRQNRIVSPGGTITRTVFDVRNNAVQTWVGTNDVGATDADPTGGGAAGNNMVLVSQNQFDGGFASGDGNLTQTRSPVDANPDNDRITTFAYDWRNRQTNMDGEENQHFVYTLDNLNRVTLTQQLDLSGPAAVLVGQTATLFDDRGQTYQTVQYAVTGGAVGNSLTSNTWFDAAGNTIKGLPAGSNAFTKTMIDGIGRAMASYYGYYTGGGSEPYSQVGQITSSNLIIEQSLMTFDAAGNLIEVDRYQRFDPGNTSPTAGGVLNGPAGPDPKARVTYVAAWFDGIGRQKAVADYGTNGNVALTRPATAPASSSAVLVSQVVFNIRGEAFQTIDPMGAVTQTSFDNANRRIQLIENYVSGGTGPDQNRTMTWTYNGDGNMISITAYNAATGNQTTAFEFGVSAPASGFWTNDLLHAVTYPDGETVIHEYNRQSQRITTTDQNGTVHQFAFDNLGRQTTDQVATLGNGIDDAIMAIATAYEVRNLVTTITSLDSSGNAVNQVQRVYNGFRQLAGEYQEHGGAVNMASTPLVQYGFADGSANTIRPTSLTYPNGNVLALGYGTAGGIDDNLSRIDSLTWQGTQVCAYTFLGAGGFVRADYVQPGVRYDLITGSGENPYAGFDQFGRIVSCLWDKFTGTTGAVDQFNYGYDLASNRLWRQNVVAGSLGQNFDELYAYDGLYQLKDMQRGQLNGTQTAIVSGTLAFHETWNLDQTGNWSGYTQDATGGSTLTLAQTRAANRLNEITEISNTTGPGWITPQYDPAGNMTRVPQPNNASAGYSATWDAWNRLVQLSDGGSVVAQFAYDGLSRRTLASYPSETRHIYYSANWQILEERLGTLPATMPAACQFAWGTRYIDDLILRDRTTAAGLLAERLYALHDANWNVTAICDG